MDGPIDLNTPHLVLQSVDCAQLLKVWSGAVLHARVNELCSQLLSHVMRPESVSF